MNSMNNRFIVRAYKTDKGLRSTVQSGIAMIQQKVEVVGLELLVDMVIPVGQQALFFNAGDKVYIREELLYTQAWAKQILKSDAIDGEFIIIEMPYVEFIKKANE